MPPTQPATPTTFSTTAVPNSSLRLTLRVGIRWPQPELICLNLRQVVLTGETDEGVSLGHIPYCGVEDWLATGNDIEELPAGPDTNDLAALVYTSGTTGRPKVSC